MIDYIERFSKVHGTQVNSTTTINIVINRHMHIVNSTSATYALFKTILIRASAKKLVKPIQHTVLKNLGNNRAY